jgi:putative DNA primase/helicase
MSQTDLRADIIAFLQNSSPKGKQATTSFVNNVVANLEGKTLVPEATRIPSFLSQPERQGSRLITVKNGIFDVQQNMAGNESFLQAHTSDFFSTSCLPFEYCQTAKCPTWIKFLNKMLPDHEIQTFLQEWFGYNLIFDTSQHKFVLFIGEGANGKTVVCVVLRALLGQENISAVGLEQFNPTRTFPLAAMSGKLANIVEEIGEVDKVAEGILKNFVAGGVMTIERKNQDAFETTATARLTFATNVLPRFKDRSSGLWRRMMPIPFCVQILNPAEQNRKLTDSAWWEESNELSGILNWAIQGLVRLNERGHFTEPSACRKLREEYRDEANPAATFLQENCISQPNKIISTTHLYKIYSDWMEGQNCKALGQPQFAREVKKKFPKAILSPNAKRQSDTSRSREWMGIGLLVKNGMLVEEMDDKL